MCHVDACACFAAGCLTSDSETVLIHAYAYMYIEVWIFAEFFQFSNFQIFKKLRSLSMGWDIALIGLIKLDRNSGTEEGALQLQLQMRQYRDDEM